MGAMKKLYYERQLAQRLRDPVLDRAIRNFKDLVSRTHQFPLTDSLSQTPKHPENPPKFDFER